MMRPLALIVLLVIAGPTFAIAAPVSEESPREGYLAPSFSGALTDGKNLSLRQFEGRAVLLNFWATWCAPCRHEMPELNRLAASLPVTQAVVIGIAQDSSQAELAKFLNEVSVAYPIVVDPKQEIGKRYRVRAMPVTFLIGGDGRIREQILGPRKWDEPVWRDKLLKAAGNP